MPFVNDQVIFTPVGGYDDWGPAYVPLNANFLKKVASVSYIPEKIAEFADQLRAREDGRYVLLNALGAGEWYGCFPAGTVILMGDGRERFIEDILPGDNVVTHRNRVRKVARIFKRHHRKGLVKVILSSRIRPLRATPNHPIEIVPRDEWTRARQKILARRKVAASDLKRGDRVVMPLSRDLKRIPAAFEIEDDFAYVPIKAVENEEFDGVVHNIEVDEDHTYVAEGMVVGNSNKNGDYFNEWSLLGESIPPDVQEFIRDKGLPIPSEWGYKTFERYAFPYMHHDNDDEAKSVGERVCCAAYNEKMHRVELIIFIKGEKAPEVVRKIDEGEPLAFSMGARLPFDVCLRAGAPILGPDGLKNIEDIKISDFVFTQKNRARPVSKVFRRSYTGTMITPEIEGLSTKTAFTENHPILAFRDKASFVAAGMIRPKDLVAIPKNSVEMVRRNLLKPDWRLPAIETDDFLLLPVKSVNREDVVNEPVFNLAVEEDETYHVGFIVHNCSICRNPAKKKDEYCLHLKNMINYVFPDGRKVFAYNYFPRFFDISIVHVPADRSAYALKKVASATIMGAGTQPLGRTHVMPAPVAGMEKFAELFDFLASGGNKKAEIDKVVPAESKAEDIGASTPATTDKVMDIVRKLVARDVEKQPKISPEAMEMFKRFPLNKVLSGLTSLGIVLHDDEADELIGDQALPENLENLDFPSEESTLMSVLKRLVGDRSMFDPHFTLRIVKITSAGEGEAGPRVISLVKRGSAGRYKEWLRTQVDLEKLAERIREPAVDQILFPGELEKEIVGLSSDPKIGKPDALIPFIASL